MASRSFSERPRWLARWVAAALAGATLLAVGGCRTVRPEDKEHLADPAMTFGGDKAVAAHEEHVFSNREASFGAGSVSGGGCGCN